VCADECWEWQVDDDGKNITSLATQSPTCLDQVPQNALYLFVFCFFFFFF
jgi:hypothetical protein